MMDYIIYVINSAKIIQWGRLRTYLRPHIYIKRPFYWMLSYKQFKSQMIYVEAAKQIKNEAKLKNSWC